MEQLTQQGLFDLLSNKTEPFLVTIHMDSVAKLKKTGNPHADKVITKHSIIEGVIGKNYKEEREAVSEATSEVYVPKPRAWGSLVNPYVIEYQGKHYLQVFIIKENDPVYQLDGVIIPVTDIQSWLPERNTQVVAVKDIKFENIKRIIFRQLNQEYEMVLTK